jgi:hypothetical protein
MGTVSSGMTELYRFVADPECATVFTGSTVHR